MLINYLELVIIVGLLFHMQAMTANSENGRAWTGVMDLILSLSLTMSVHSFIITAISISSIQSHSCFYFTKLIIRAFDLCTCGLGERNI